MPKASSTVTTGWTENAVVAVALATPEGCVENTSCVAAPKLETPKVGLVTGFAGTAPLAVAVRVYGVTRVLPDTGL